VSQGTADIDVEVEPIVAHIIATWPVPSAGRCRQSLMAVQTSSATMIMTATADDEMNAAVVVSKLEVPVPEGD